MPNFPTPPTTNPFFSIVIPVYNVERYISRCLNSCIQQIFKEIEIIIVDDCGTDDSMQIAQEFAKDNRIKILHNATNLGTFHTRLKGIQEANGEFILFVDSDDYIDLDTCERIYNLLALDYQENGEWTDVLCYLFAEKDTKLDQTIIKLDTHNPYQEMINFSRWNLCNKIYKRSILKTTSKFIEQYFPNLPKMNMAEDALQFFITAIFVKRSFGIRDSFYHYCENLSSITKTEDELKISQSVQHFQVIIKMLDLIPYRNLPHPKIVQTNKITLQKNLAINAFIFQKTINGQKMNVSIYISIKLWRYYQSWKAKAKILLINLLSND
ncbi:hypothetical protein BBW65_00860 [Helicobacter enhydrae]|uniref:Glycosyltransferase 2-like domain-containing protein n=1 Tax=Helicobacter enhydrae TaxID=222136 RepID=A0A1B1U3Z8_9HELI|nr:glycosyltransferase family A protein [Helicobacter enhydrae]ANV97452.1 hypothetical protein BBW65_00860 [Helicobacter enhydrae]